MKRLIDKDALIAEIENIIADETESIKSFEHRKNVSEMQKTNARIDVLMHIRSLLDTLETKDVNFERELGKYVSDGIHRFYPNEGDDYYNMDSVVWQDYVIETAEHFYELGMQAKEGNTLAKAKGFLVRDKDDYTAIYSTKPERGKTEWVDGNHPRNANESSCLFTMDAYLLPNVEFNDEPVEVEVTITKKGE